MNTDIEDIRKKLVPVKYYINGTEVSESKRFYK